MLVPPSYELELFALSKKNLSSRTYEKNLASEKQIIAGGNRKMKKLEARLLISQTVPLPTILKHKEKQVTELLLTPGNW